MPVPQSILDVPGRTTPRISVAITTYNRVELLRQVLASLLDDEASAEIVVYSDGSDDGTAEFLRALAAREPRIKPLISTVRSGRVSGRRQAVEATSSPIVLMIDDDVLPEPGLVSGHAERHRRAERDTVVMGYMPTEVPGRWAKGTFATRLYAAEYERHCRWLDAEPESVLLGLWGGNVSLPRASFTEVEAIRFWPDECYHEDQFLGFELARLGLVGSFDRGLRASHRHSRSIESFAREARNQGQARALMASRYPELVGLADPDEVVGDLPHPLRAVVRLADRPRSHRLVRSSLIALCRVAGSTRCATVEERAAQMLRRVEKRAGLNDQLRSRTAAVPHGRESEEAAVNPSYDAPMAHGSTIG